MAGMKLTVPDVKFEPNSKFDILLSFLKLSFFWYCTFILLFFFIIQSKSVKWWYSPKKETPRGTQDLATSDMACETTETRETVHNLDERSGSKSPHSLLLSLTISQAAKSQDNLGFYFQCTMWFLEMILDCLHNKHLDIKSTQLFNDCCCCVVNVEN